MSDILIFGIIYGPPIIVAVLAMFFTLGYELGRRDKSRKIKALGEELRRVRWGITDSKVVIGYNIAVSIFNKYLGGKET